MKCNYTETLMILLKLSQILLYNYQLLFKSECIFISYTSIEIMQITGYHLPTQFRSFSIFLHCKNIENE